jgi:hypothetical protein
MQGRGIKATRVAAEEHSTSPVGGTAGGPAGALVVAGACWSVSLGCLGRGEPNDGAGLRRAAVREWGGDPDADVSHGGAAHRTGTWERALASMPYFQFQNSHVWTPDSFVFQFKL